METETARKEKKNTDNKDYLLRNVKWECFAL